MSGTSVTLTGSNLETVTAVMFNGAPAEFFAFFKWIYLAGGIWFMASCVVNVISGLCLRARKLRTFSLVVAGFNCMHLPLGTVLGVFTMIVLMRDSVRELYDANPTMLGEGGQC